jgi:hypothetical protein
MPSPRLTAPHRQFMLPCMNTLYPPRPVPESSEARSPVSEEKPAPKKRQETLEADNPHVRRYNMYPQKAFGGHIETKVLPDGRIKYTIFPFPYDGSDQRTLIVDPANPEEMRAVKQLHLIPDIKNDPGMGVYVIDADLLDAKKKAP